MNAESSTGATGEVVERAFCFVDLAGFTALAESHGDDMAVGLVEHFVRLVTGSLEDDGELVGTVGDAAFLAAASPEGAIRIVERLWRAAVGVAGMPEMRAGVHYGPAQRAGPTYIGTAVNIAARVTALAREGQVVVTAPVAQAALAAGWDVEPLGSQRLRNLRGSYELSIVRVADAASTVAIDPVCRMRVDPATAAGHLVHAGRSWWFCSLACVATFAVDPAPFTPDPA